MLSSYFVYNSVGSIDENALQTLSLVINLAKEIRKSENEGELEEDDVLSIFPAFLWVVRDFSLKLEDSKGKQISSKQYLEQSLEFIEGISETVNEKNRIRRMLKHFFRERDCMTMVRPVESETELQTLSSLKDYEMREEFVEQMKVVRSKILRKTETKKLNGRPITGIMLYELAKAYASSMNSGAAPSIQTAWHYLVQNESDRAKTEAISYLRNSLSNFDQTKITSANSDWKTIFKIEVLEYFKKRAIGDATTLAQFQPELERLVEEEFKRFETSIFKQKESQIRNEFEQLSVTLIDEIKSGKIATIDACELRMKVIEQ